MYSGVIRMSWASISAVMKFVAPVLLDRRSVMNAGGRLSE